MGGTSNIALGICYTAGVAKNPSKIFIYGKHALSEALLHAPQALTRVYLERGAVDPKVEEKIVKAGIPTAPLSEGQAKSDMRSGASHQGVIAQLSLSKLLLPYEKFADALKVTPDTSLLLMAGLQDPHNVGALIRSAAGFGVSGVLMPLESQAPISGAVIKVSAGMAFRIPLVTVDNLQKAISDLKKRGFRVYALAGGKGTSVQQEEFSKPTVFVMGNEAAGLPQHLRALCDATLSIPIHSRTESLNVAAAGAVAMYAWSAKHGKALTA